MKKIRRISYILGGLVLLSGVLLYLYLESFVIKRSGTLFVEHLNADTTIYYDNYGIPHIEARHETDAFYALGYAHAGDRLFQMELLRRVAKGELSEILGDKLLKVDIFFRTLGLKEISKNVVAQMDFSKPEFKALKSYILGINRFMEENKTIEFKILNITPKPFTPEDTIAISGYMALSFSQAFKVDPLLYHIKNNIGYDYYKDFSLNLEPKLQEKEEEKSYAFLQSTNKLLNSLPSPLSSFLPGIPTFIGSNAWVISGKLTKSGYPLLANDPHIGFASPSVWYEAHIKTPDLELYGHYIAGIPFAPIGHTPKKAWGITMLQNDDIFFYKEKVNPNNPNQIKRDGSWVELKERREIIKVKGKADQTLTVKVSPHGPIINNITEGYKDEKSPISMWWAFSLKENNIAKAFYTLSHETKFEEIPDALESIYAPGLNILYADKEGHIAWWPTAKIPKLPPDFNTKAFIDGSKSENDIRQFLSQKEKPHKIDPENGYLVSANNDPKLTGESDYQLPGYYCHDQRFRRIQNLISLHNGNLTAEDMKKIQLDDEEQIKTELIEKLSEILEKEEQEDLSKKSLNYLKTWRGTHSLEDIGPTIYYSFLSHLVHYFFHDKLSKDMYDSLLLTYHLSNFLESIIQKSDSVWWHNHKTDKSQESVLKETWKSTLVSLVSFIGNDPSHWHWKKAHTLEQVHAIGNKKPLNLIFNIGPRGISGGYEVVNNQKFPLTKELPFKIRSGPSTRRIIDLEDTRHSFGINPTGQSGYFFDKHYKDQFELYLHDGYRPQIMDFDFIKKQNYQKLVLTPVEKIFNVN